MRGKRAEAIVTQREHTLLWYDYETSGRDPSLDRPIQLGWLRTPLSCTTSDEAASQFIRLPDDVLPSPGALMVHQIIPEQHQKLGMTEAELAASLEALITPGTWVAGYNSRRFDDRFTQHVLYRSLRDPYRWQFAEGRGRFDLYPVVLAYYALRHAAVRWPEDADGTPRFRLDRLGPLNGLDRGLRAHDAAADVTVTARLAAQLQQYDPDLFQESLARADKQAVIALIRAYGRDDGLYEVTPFAGLERGYLRPLWVPFRLGPDGDFVAFDLRGSPEHVTAEIAAIVDAGGSFSERRKRLSEIGVTLIRANRQPMLWPRSTVLSDRESRLPESHQVDREASHLGQWQAVMASEAFRALYTMTVSAFQPDSVQPERPTDVDRLLYSGGFYADSDRQLLATCPYLDPHALADWSPAFEDPRLPELVFRYRARNFPQSLTQGEWRRWQRVRREKLLSEAAPGVTLASIHRELAELAASETLSTHQLDQLQAYSIWLDNQPPL
ncbi:MAG: exodeoxyribonuclease I [Gammaproteobacteria bacterium]|nr:exodeoxyribonuclease I [Gammaproteobacteria bacterium]